MAKEFFNAKIKEVDLITTEVGLEFRMLLVTKFGEIVYGVNRPIALNKSFREDTMFGNYAGYFITRILQLAGVPVLSQVAGKAIQIIVENDVVIGLADLFDQENAIYPDQEMKEYQELARQQKEEFKADVDNAPEECEVETVN